MLRPPGPGAEVHRDYDTNPERFRLGTRLTAALGRGSLYELVADRLGNAHRVLDIGCGDGALAAVVGRRVIGLDAAAPMVGAAAAHGPVVRGDSTALPIADASVDAVTAINTLYHLPDPLVALREARRVLKPGGTFVAGTISRADSPELARWWLPAPTTFDAEDAPCLVEAVFGNVRVEAWDTPLITLPDGDAVRDYLVARFVAPAEAARIAAQMSADGLLPSTITKRGALVISVADRPRR